MAEVPASADTLLAEARAAWRQLRESESQIRRLDAYRNMSRAMRHDSLEWHSKANQARETLHRILGCRP